MTTSDPKRMSSKDDLDYGSALEELEKLVSDMEQGHVDIEHLADKVQRSAFLVSYCRERLAGVAKDLEHLALSPKEPQSP